MADVATYVVLGKVLKSRGYTPTNPPQIKKVKAGVWECRIENPDHGKLDGAPETTRRWVVYLGPDKGQGWRTFREPPTAIIEARLGVGFEEASRPLSARAED